MLQNTPSSSIQTEQRMDGTAHLSKLSQQQKQTTGKKVTQRVVKRLIDIGDPNIDHIAILGYD